MFTGIVREVGKLIHVEVQGTTAQVRIEAPLTCREAELGDSICVNGTCLTVTSLENRQFTADLSSETLHRTTFRNAHSGERLNLEPALRLMDRLGGHIVSGHVDGVGSFESIENEGEFSKIAISFPENLSPYIAEKGSLCVNGISLTIAQVNENRVSFAVIPFTFSHTNLCHTQPGDFVNLEVDILARYVERLMSVGMHSHGTGLTLDKLRQYGFTSE